MALHYLIFDSTDAEDGSGSFDTMASATAAGWPALQAELAQVLAWAHATFAHGPGPLDEGCDWDLDLQATQETSHTRRLQFDAASGRLTETDDAAQAGRATLRHSISLSLSGTAAFCAAFRQRFDLDANEDGL
ncbi:MAG: hypothetical protein CFE45_09515 [Burkholderiales bacterium PBB5]|nr:MAG: hypothetical protein CFE45_09515 [Burkholderiales bacterium PBB5]